MLYLIYQTVFPMGNSLCQVTYGHQNIIQQRYGFSFNARFFFFFFLNYITWFKKWGYGDLSRWFAMFTRNSCLVFWGMMFMMTFSTIFFTGMGGTFFFFKYIYIIYILSQVHFIGLMRLVAICNGLKIDFICSTMSKKVKMRKARGR